MTERSGIQIDHVHVISDRAVSERDARVMTETFAADVNAALRTAGLPPPSLHIRELTLRAREADLSDPRQRLRFADAVVRSILERTRE